MIKFQKDNKKILLKLKDLVEDLGYFSNKEINQFYVDFFKLNPIK